MLADTQRPAHLPVADIRVAARGNQGALLTSVSLAALNDGEGNTALANTLSVFAKLVVKCEKRRHDIRAGEHGSR